MFFFVLYQTFFSFHSLYYFFFIFLLPFLPPYPTFFLPSISRSSYLPSLPPSLPLSSLPHALCFQILPPSLPSCFLYALCLQILFPPFQVQTLPASIPGFQSVVNACCLEPICIVQEYSLDSRRFVPNQTLLSISLHLSSFHQPMLV